MDVVDIVDVVKNTRKLHRKHENYQIRGHGSLVTGFFMLKNTPYTNPEGSSMPLQNITSLKSPPRSPGQT